MGEVVKRDIRDFKNTYPFFCINADAFRGVWFYKDGLLTHMLAYVIFTYMQKS